MLKLGVKVDILCRKGSRRGEPSYCPSISRKTYQKCIFLVSQTCDMHGDMKDRERFPEVIFESITPFDI